MGPTPSHRSMWCSERRVGCTERRNPCSTDRDFLGPGPEACDHLVDGSVRFRTHLRGFLAGLHGFQISIQLCPPKAALLHKPLMILFRERFMLGEDEGRTSPTEFH